MASSSSPYQHTTGIINNNNNNDGWFQQCLGTSSSPIPAPSQDNNDTLSDIMKPTEDFLASEMSKLSVQERSKAMDELHCVGEELKETPEMIQQSLKEFDKLLQKKKAKIYDLAASQNRSYVEDPNFRLKFLRANIHDVGESVNQMLGLLSRKEIYFGRDAIARDITLDDLTAEETEILFSGLYYHIQDGTDRNGRMVVYLLNHILGQLSSAETAIRVNYFMFFNILSPMPSVQKKGIVLCYYDFSTPDKPAKLPKLDALLKFMDFVPMIPVRRSALHLCLKPHRGGLVSSNKFLENVLRRFGRSTRSRARLHYGSDMELQYTLKSYGLNMENCPVDATGNLRQDILDVWAHKYLHQRNRNSVSSPPAKDGEIMTDEQEDSTDSMVQALTRPKLPIAPQKNDHGTDPPANTAVSLIKPTPDDVLFGKGSVLQMHPGNVRFRQFIKDHQEEYNNTPRYKRVTTFQDLTGVLLGKGIRFLKKTESGGWVESDFAEVEKKVKQLFRSQKKSRK
ncbi:unnamed protein product [Cylindrotheca closterium]|uniref:DUF6824 domain-containing protein n=1 Tax=Cylindrotheca closterium TaxID=2856 RepID=A0AAD2JKI2_9STRA|nr:unnamed protein product [Cylindrotheca closterium]